MCGAPDFNIEDHIDVTDFIYIPRPTVTECTGILFVNVYICG